MKPNRPYSARVDVDFAEDRRYAISNREARLSLLYWLCYMVTVLGVSWTMGAGKSPEELTFVLGLPAWFFWGVVVTGAVFSVLPYFLVRFLFTDMPLAADADEA